MDEDGTEYWMTMLALFDLEKRTLYGEMFRGEMTFDENGNLIVPDEEDNQPGGDYGSSEGENIGTEVNPKPDAGYDTPEVVYPEGGNPGYVVGGNGGIDMGYVNTETGYGPIIMDGTMADGSYVYVKDGVSYTVANGNAYQYQIATVR